MQGRVDARRSCPSPRPFRWIATMLALSLLTVSACRSGPPGPQEPADPGVAGPTEDQPAVADDSEDGKNPESDQPETAPGQGLSIPTPFDETAALATEEAEDLDALQALILDSWTRREDEIVISVMGDPFHLGLWRSEGTQAPPRDAVIQLGYYYPGAAPVLALDPQPDLSEMLDGSDPDSFWGPDVVVLRNIVTSGWGAEGKGQAILVLARHPNGFPYFHGALIAPLGFDMP